VRAIEDLAREAAGDAGYRAAEERGKAMTREAADAFTRGLIADVRRETQTL